MFTMGLYNPLWPDYSGMKPSVITRNKKQAEKDKTETSIKT